MVKLRRYTLALETLTLRGYLKTSNGWPTAFVLRDQETPAASAELLNDPIMREGSSDHGTGV